MEYQVLKVILTTLCTAIALMLTPVAAGQSLADNNSDFIVSELDELTYQGVAHEEMLYRLQQSEDYVSIASGRLQALQKAPAITSVITQSQITASGATELNQLLEGIAGVHVYPSALNILNTGYVIRGIHTQQNAQVLLLVNGQPIQEMYSASRPNTFRMPVHDISRVEIIKGPASALYGADAFAGVINVVTKTGQRNKGWQFGLAHGSFNSNNYWANFSQAFDHWHLYASFEHLDSAGDHSRIMQSDAVSLSGISQAPAPLQTAFDINSYRISVGGKKWHANYWLWQQNNAGVGNGAAQALDTVGYVDHQFHQVDGQYHLLRSPRNTLSLQSSLFALTDQNHYQLFPPGYQQSITTDNGIEQAYFIDGMIGHPTVNEQNYKLAVVWQYSGMSAHHLRSELGVQRRQLQAKEYKNFGPSLSIPGPISATLTNATKTGDIFIDSQRRNNLYFALQDEWQLSPSWSLTSGFRFDQFSDFGQTTTPRGALVYKLSKNTTIKALYGEAYRAPAFAELHVVNNPVVLGNKDLEPEQIATKELAIIHKFHFGLIAQLNLFDYRANKLIDYVPRLDPQTQLVTGVNQAQNIRQLEGKGSELELKWQLNDTLKLKANMAQSQVKENDVNTSDAPARQHYISVNWQPNNRWQMQLQWHSVNDKSRDQRLNSFAQPIDKRAPIANSEQLNANLTYQVTKQIRLNLTANNLLEQRNYQPSLPSLTQDFPQPSRQLWLGLTLTE